MWGYMKIATGFKWLINIYYSGIYSKSVGDTFFFCYKSKFILCMKIGKLVGRKALIINLWDLF